MRRCNWGPPPPGGRRGLQALRAYALDLGLVFQIVDDVLDVRLHQRGAGQACGQRRRQTKDHL